MINMNTPFYKAIKFVIALIKASQKFPYSINAKMILTF